MAPVLRVRRDDQDLVVVQHKIAKVQLGLGVGVVLDALPLEPAQQPPLRRRDVALAPTLQRIADLPSQQALGLGPLQTT